MLSMITHPKIKTGPARDITHIWWPVWKTGSLLRPCYFCELLTSELLNLCNLCATLTPQTKVVVSNEGCSYNEVWKHTWNPHVHTLRGGLLKTYAGHALFIPLPLNQSPLWYGWSEVNHNTASHFLAFSLHVALVLFPMGNSQVKKTHTMCLCAA